jgi:3',5'-nucleoside bisphosphate phosphatase
MTSRVYDLHCHSTASDGGLSPTQLVTRAKSMGVDVLALTDHDTVQGLDEARSTAKNLGIEFINGIELSTSFHNQCLHIVGLNIDPNSSSLNKGLEFQQDLRRERAMKISNKLEKKHIHGAYETISASIGNGEITRTHFAEFLVEKGYVQNLQSAFDHYLNKDKPAYVSTTWASMEEGIQWISDAGGIAVLAHPMRYKLSKKWMNKVVHAFKEAGGRGIEVVTGRAGSDEILFGQQYAYKFELLASQGSDFHFPDNPYLELGRLARLPPSLTPVWTQFTV